MEEKYFPENIEAKWQRRWAEAGTFEAREDDPRPKFYALEMLPYPSGFLHMGHVRNYSIGDALAWYKRLRGFNVLHPIGWDSFGQPAEQAAIKRGIQPREWTEKNIELMRGQFQRLGISYDWSREIAAHRPEYYRWNQWFFLKMFERGLAYRSRRFVNWCGSCQTVLANEQVENGRCWRCDSVVGRTELDQWFLKTTAYASELDAELDTMTGWPERVRAMQRNWIGRSEGTAVRFPILDAGGAPTADSLEIFTTRLDTIYGSTFCVVAPRHPVLGTIPGGSEARRRLDDFLRRIDARNVTRSGMEPEEKEGIDTGLRVRNPYNGETLPVWSANFVLMEYGTGAIMSVPAHDERDFDFANRYGLAVRPVIIPKEGGGPARAPHSAMVEDGSLVDSDPFTGLGSAEARTAMLRDGEARGIARGIVQYRLLDWGISRQRYWGTPIPIIYCEGCGMVPVPVEDLPVVLPEDAPLTGEGGSPLARVKSFVETPCPRCGGAGRRETDTMDTFVDSSWYFLRYCDPENDRAPFDPAVVAAWVPIDLYVGGITHATLHLIYCRFFTKVLRDLGLSSFGEQFRPLLCHGMFPL